MGLHGACLRSGCEGIHELPALSTISGYSNSTGTGSMVSSCDRPVERQPALFPQRHALVHNAPPIDEAQGAVGSVEPRRRWRRKDRRFRHGAARRLKVTPELVPDPSTGSGSSRATSKNERWPQKRASVEARPLTWLRPR